MLTAISSVGSASSLRLWNVTLSITSDGSLTKVQTSFRLSPVLFTPSTKIVGFSGCLSHLIASKIAQKETMHHLGIIWSVMTVIPNGQNLLTDLPDSCNDAKINMVAETQRATRFPWHVFILTEKTKVVFEKFKEKISSLIEWFGDIPLWNNKSVCWWQEIGNTPYTQGLWYLLTKLCVSQNISFSCDDCSLIVSVADFLGYPWYNICTALFKDPPEIRHVSIVSLIHKLPKV